MKRKMQNHCDSTVFEVVCLGGDGDTVKDWSTTKSHDKKSKEKALSSDVK